MPIYYLGRMNYTKILLIIGAVCIMLGAALKVFDSGLSYVVLPFGLVCNVLGLMILIYNKLMQR